jgi:hypothetical protein
MKKFNEAINEILQIIGEQTLPDGQPIEDIYEAEQASLHIDNIKQEVLSEGWTFNTEENWPLTPNASGLILVPYGALRVDAVSGNIIRKDGKLYNRDTHTFQFTSSVLCDVVWDIDFDLLPPMMQQYITLKAGRIVYQRFIGDTNMLSVLKNDEEEARLRMYMHEDDVGDYNIFDDTSVSRIISRTTNPSGLRG